MLRCHLQELPVKKLRAYVGTVEVDWLDEHDSYVNPMGSKGIGELGIVGTAAAIAN